MRIAHSYPPNIKRITAVFPVDGQKGAPVFTYGDTLYNPSGVPVPEHLMEHEKVHAEQQGHSEHGAEAWWERFLTDPAFRLEQELEAYAVQYRFGKEKFSGKDAASLLHILAGFLSSEAYGSLLSYAEAASKIRNRAKDLAGKATKQEPAGRFF